MRCPLPLRGKGIPIKRPAGALLLTILVATVGMAQTRVSGIARCGKRDRELSMDVGDQPNHSFVLEQGRCTWTKPLEIAGAKSKDAFYTMFSESIGPAVRDLGYLTGTMDSGDKCTVRLQGGETLRDAKPVSQHGTWRFVSGSGKVKGIKGSGSYEGRAEGDTMVLRVEGEYALPE